MQRPQQHLWWQRLSCATLVGMILCLLTSAALAAEPEEDPQTAALKRQVSINNLKQIMLALLNYHDVNQSFPPAFSSAEGKPLLSWRVAILPYIEGGNEIYQEFHLDEPWDSEHNKPLAAKIPQVYQSPTSKLTDGRTVYLTPRGAGTMFPGASGIKVRNITDGTSNTLAVLEVDDEAAVEWTKPDDWKFDPKNPKTGLGHQQPGVVITALGDGSVRQLPNTMDAEKLKALITIAGREVIAAE